MVDDKQRLHEAWFGKTAQWSMSEREYDALKKGQRVEVDFSGGMSSGKVLLEVGRTSYSKKYDVYSKKLYYIDEDTNKPLTKGRVVFTLFKRMSYRGEVYDDPRISLALGDMGVQVKSLKKHGSRAEIVGTKTAGARFDAGGPWQAQDEDSRWHDVTIDKSDIAVIGKLFDAAWKKRWAKAMKELDKWLAWALPRIDTLGEAWIPGAASDVVFGRVSKDEGNLAGDVWDDVYYSRGGVEDVANNYFSNRGGESADLEHFSLGMDDQVREHLWSHAQIALKRVKDPFAKKAIEIWSHQLRSTYWD
jgi:hypothetical protein